MINKILRENDERENFSSFKKGLLNVMTESLAQLVSEGFFENLDSNRSNYVVFVSITDDDNAESVENESAKVINSRPTYDEFLKRYGAGADHLQGS